MRIIFSHTPPSTSSIVRRMMSQTWGTNQHYHLAGRIQEPRIFFFLVMVMTCKEAVDPVIAALTSSAIWYGSLDPRLILMLRRWRLAAWRMSLLSMSHPVGWTGIESSFKCNIFLQRSDIILGMNSHTLCKHFNRQPPKAFQYVSWYELVKLAGGLGRCVDIVPSR